MKAAIGTVIGALLLAAPATAANANLQFGPQASYGAGIDGNAGFGVGGRVVVDLAQKRRGLAFVGSLDYFLSPEGGAEGQGLTVDVSYVELNANLTHTFGGGGRRVKKVKTTRLTPYAGLGLNLAHRSASVEGNGFDTSSSTTKIGLNLLGGLKITHQVFAELRGELGGGEQLLLTAGFLF
jgi:opacity protein-like surface antigen